MWLGGLLAAVGTVLLQVLALASGPLLLVQPLLVCALLFALPASVILEERRPSVVEWLWALLLVVGLVVFLLAARPSTGSPLPDGGRLFVLGACGVVLAGIAVVLAYGPGRRHRAALLGFATGVSYGLAASLMKYSIALVRVDAGQLFRSWPVYALLVVGTFGILLNQVAYQAGPLAGALPPMIITDPVVATIIAVVAFGEVVASSPAAITLEVVGSCGVVLAIVRLAKLASGRGSRAGGS